MVALVGYTGFVGSNICIAAVDQIGAVYNSKNIKDAYGLRPDLLIYAGLGAEKYLANHLPKKDMELIIQAEENIKRINPKKLVLISTIDVFSEPGNVDENSSISTKNLHPYGYNRYQLELWVRRHYSDGLIIRLPGLFGRNIKKNFIYDYINVIPAVLKQEKMDEISRSHLDVRKYYTLQDNGFYRLNMLTDHERGWLKREFQQIGFTALNFTDSRSRYQFYNLSRLWSDIGIALASDIRLLHMAVEPISAGELYRYLTGEDFVNELGGKPADYDFRSLHAETFGGSEGYICSKEEIMRNIADFVKEQQEGGQ